MAKSLYHRGLLLSDSFGAPQVWIPREPWRKRSLIDPRRWMSRRRCCCGGGVCCDICNLANELLTTLPDRWTDHPGWCPPPYYEHTCADCHGDFVVQCASACNWTYVSLACSGGGYGYATFSILLEVASSPITITLRSQYTISNTGEYSASLYGAEVDSCDDLTGSVELPWIANDSNGAIPPCIQGASASAFVAF